MKRAWIAAGVLGLVSCARAPLTEQAARPDVVAEARAADQRSAALEQEVVSLTAAAAPPDCARACPLVGQICDLSQRICSLARQRGADPELADRCAAGEQRCRRAREQSASACSCQDGSGR